MEYRSDINPAGANINLVGKFTFSDYEKFRSIIELLDNGKINQVAMSLEAIEFIDSAGLGMLLLLREAAEKSGVGLTIIKPMGQVKKMFEISNFDKLFSIQY